ncbi:MAG: hypothetical protein GY920_17920 [Aliivibrio sp.]|nr:hypothetical protein [Aliivibrio sp.]MCP4255782.1 hypothetical protein [Candidatus Scalindua sp.]|tara:strand:+ start:1451 stop:1675 length:225 start_codon:yes stop_codon:yes gene_type:complete
MREETRQIGEAIASHPKTAYMVIMLTNISAWWVEWVDPLVDAVTSVLGVVLVSVLIRYHWQNTKKLKKEINENK